MSDGLFIAKKRIKRDEDAMGWEYDTLEDGVDDLQPALSRYRYIARQLGYTQTEAGLRTAVQIVAEAECAAAWIRDAGAGADIGAAIGEEVIL